MNDSDINLILRRAKRANSTVIDLSNKCINSIPSELFEYSSITKLNLSNNKIIDIDPAIKIFKNLKELDLTNNQISILPREILMIDLSSLKLQGNPICKNFSVFKELTTNVKAELEKYFNKIDKPIEILLPKVKYDKKPEINHNLKENTYENTNFLSSLSINVSSEYVLDKEKLNETNYLIDVINQLKNKLKSYEIKSTKISNADDLISTKRNWMELGSNSKNDNDVKSSSTFKFDLEKKLEENENALQKEILLNKRLKNELDKVNQQFRGSECNNLSNYDISKTVKEANFDQIELFEKIGQGGFSVIHRAKWNFINVSVKLIFDPNVTEELLAEFNNEIKMLTVLRHPNIVLLLGITKKPQKLSIITEYIENGCLFDFLHKTNKEISIPQRLKMIRQIARTMAFIHNSGVVHRDLKSYNILLDENYNAKICDFGLAKFKNELSFGSGQFSGTPAYMAPELYLKKAYDEKVDIFAFGTLIWEIMARKIPYDGYEIGEIKTKCLSDEKLNMPKSFSNDIIELINSCRKLDPIKRPSFEEISNKI